MSTHIAGGDECNEENREQRGMERREEMGLLFGNDLWGRVSAWCLRKWWPEVQD